MQFTVFALLLVVPILASPFGQVYACGLLLLFGQAMVKPVIAIVAIIAKCFRAKSDLFFKFCLFT